MKSKTPPVPVLGTAGRLVFYPQAGREQLALHPGLAVFCPITSKLKACPLWVSVSGGF